MSQVLYSHRRKEAFSVKYKPVLSSVFSEKNFLVCGLTGCLFYLPAIKTFCVNDCLVFTW